MLESSHICVHRNCLIFVFPAAKVSNGLVPLQQCWQWSVQRWLLGSGFSMLEPLEVRRPLLL